MQKMKQLRNEKGFTIIEVMIVLAIAGFIMGIVFIAIPALQRNSRNTARQADASLISAGMGECLTNKNGDMSRCTTAEVGKYVDASKLKQLNTAFVVVASGLNAGVEYTTLPTTATTAQATVSTAAKCNSSSDNAAGATAREYAVLYQVETQSGTAYRCIGS